MLIDKIVVGSYAANCYLVADEATKEAIVIDPGAEPERIYQKISENAYKVVAIVLTHGHGDHIGAAKAIREKTSAPIWIHHDDAVMLEDAAKNLTSTMGKSISFTADKTIGHREMYAVGSHKYKVIHTPGHTRGGICLFFEKENVLFTGDTLFYGSIGRSDLDGGNHKQLIQSIVTELMPLGEEVSVYPGHGASTRIGFERKKNPFIQG